MRTIPRSVATTAVVLLAALAAGADRAPSGGIAWHGTWKRGLAEAERTRRPILLLAAAPQCHGISGIW